VFDAIVDSSLGMDAVCALCAILAVAPGFMSPYVVQRLPGPGRAPPRFPMRAFAKATLIVFIIMINAAGVGITHRIPIGSTLVSVGFLMLLFLPPDEQEDSPAH
jgi:hypothetical protein